MDTFDKLKAEKDRLVEQEWQTAATAAGWKSPEEVTSIIQAAIDAFNWNTSDIVAKAREEALRKVGWWLEQLDRGHIEAIFAVMVKKQITALKSGRMPEGK